MEECLRIIENFHGFKAPGLVLGIFMVDQARELIGLDVEADAIVETRHCLPDAVQLFTPCTVGNGWLKIIDWNKFALTLYDRHTYLGFRVRLDLEKAGNHPNIYNWYMRRVSKKDLPLDILLDSILASGRSVLSWEAVKMIRYRRRLKKGATNVCPGCGEAFAAEGRLYCPACRGVGYYAPGNHRSRSAGASKARKSGPARVKTA
jgi:formylmethanofuran dehydrogenase subunit E